MFGHTYEDSEATSPFGCSPPNRPFLAEGSDLFRAVMEDIKEDSNSRLSRAVVDKTSRACCRDSVGDSLTSTASEDSAKYMCKRCLSDSALCRCYQGLNKGAVHRVQWVDEMYNRPLAIEQCISELDSEGRVSPVNVSSMNSIKPILKHKATCIIIVSK
ncbi:hypothetical protein DPMN_092917 [Dreissena polymorpha]|uniref:Uncharacterized protein n=1 Tax=Dreissena polymorpha TaxID=45954 RepID=A0A9D4L272_DREPO|nr:hypothetical protein DPMN_092917 [Dreissena polymorpha]